MFIAFFYKNNTVILNINYVYIYLWSISIISLNLSLIKKASRWNLAQWYKSHHWKSTPGEVLLPIFPPPSTDEAWDYRPIVGFMFQEDRCNSYTLRFSAYYQEHELFFPLVVENRNLINNLYRPWWPKMLHNWVISFWWQKSLVEEKSRLRNFWVWIGIVFAAQ